MYEKLLEEANASGLTVIEHYPFVSSRIRGLYCDNIIALSAQIETNAERTVVLCEELTHACHSFGNILHDRRMERRTRERMFDRLIGKNGLVRACLAGCRHAWEFAEFLGVPESFFEAAIQNYKQRYGTMTEFTWNNHRYALSFEPIFRIQKISTLHDMNERNIS